MLRDIKVLHLEPTDVCQAECPLCAREIDSQFDKKRHCHLTMDQILAVIDAEKIAGLNKMFMCGNYGDPAAGKHTIDIYKSFRTLNPNIVLGMNTNGALQNTNWWQQVAAIMNQPQDYVVFSIDGLEDTNSIYRKNVQWHKLIDNAKAFVSAGGSAHWDMLVYAHNQHQVEECQALAKQLGFKWFRAKVSKRGFKDNLAAPINWIRPEIHSIQIQCHALNEQSLYIDAQGREFPCCWIGGSDRYQATVNFQQIQQSWNEPNPHQTCRQTCGSANGQSNFTSQWQRNVQLC